MSKQNILLTAGSSKLGRILVEFLSTLEFNIMFTYCQNENEKNRLEATCKNVIGIKHNFLKDNSEKLFEKALNLSNNNKIDILINNASTFSKSSLASFNETSFFENIKINTLPSIELSKLFLKQNLEASSIINMLDASVTYYNKNYFEYNLSKKLLYEITKILALEGAPKTRVNAVAPGVILTEHTKLNPTLKNINLLSKFGSTRDIAHTVKFLIDSEFMTGQVIFVDGGQGLKKGNLNEI